MVYTGNKVNMSGTERFDKYNCVHTATYAHGNLYIGVVVQIHYAYFRANDALRVI